MLVSDEGFNAQEIVHGVFNAGALPGRRRRGIDRLAQISNGRARVAPALPCGGVWSARAMG